MKKEKHSKRYRLALKLFDSKKEYSISEAIKIAKETSKVKFNATVETAFKLNIDPKHSEQQLRGSFVLPNGTGKSQKVLVITSTHQSEATKAGADYVGGIEYITKIEKEKWFDFDVIVATSEMMPKLAKIGKILGPKGLMPNVKIGTITTKIKKTVDDIKKGKVVYRADKGGNIHFIIGKTSFTNEQLESNYKTILANIKKIRPSGIKGKYILNNVISTSMGPSIKIEKATFL